MTPQPQLLQQPITVIHHIIIKPTPHLPLIQIPPPIPRHRLRDLPFDLCPRRRQIPDPPIEIRHRPQGLRLRGEEIVAHDELAEEDDRVGGVHVRGGCHGFVEPEGGVCGRELAVGGWVPEGGEAGQDGWIGGGFEALPVGLGCGVGGGEGGGEAEGAGLGWGEEG